MNSLGFHLSFIPHLKLGCTIPRSPWELKKTLCSTEQGKIHDNKSCSVENPWILSQSAKFKTCTWLSCNWTSRMQSICTRQVYWIFQLSQNLNQGYKYTNLESANTAGMKVHQLRAHSQQKYDFLRTKSSPACMHVRVHKPWQARQSESPWMTYASFINKRFSK